MDKPQWSPELFLADLKKAGVDDGIELALMVCDTFLLQARTNPAAHDYCVGEIQKVLDLYDPADYDPSITWGLLTSAWNGQRVGLIYQPFLAKVEKYFKDNDLLKGETFDSFSGLRGVPDGPTLGDIARAVGGNPNLF